MSPMKASLWHGTSWLYTGRSLLFSSSVEGIHGLKMYRQPLHLSTFTMDDFEQALRHSVLEPPCPLVAEVHSTLIYNLRTVPFSREGAINSLRDNDSADPSSCLGVSVDQLIEALDEIGNNWERAPLRHAETRSGWEESLIGCLKDASILSLLYAIQLLIVPSSTPLLKTSLGYARYSPAYCSLQRHILIRFHLLAQRQPRVRIPWRWVFDHFLANVTIPFDRRTRSRSSHSCVI